MFKGLDQGFLAPSSRAVGVVAARREIAGAWAAKLKMQN
jgi:hypothetical protein